MDHPLMEPDVVALRQGGASLVLRFADGHENAFPAATLRRLCRCAGCTAERTAGPIHVDPTLRITTAAPMGSYALSLGFSDGHARGVFPYAFLATLIEQEMAA